MAGREHLADLGMGFGQGHREGALAVGAEAIALEGGNSLGVPQHRLGRQHAQQCCDHGLLTCGHGRGCQRLRPCGQVGCVVPAGAGGRWQCGGGRCVHGTTVAFSAHVHVGKSAEQQGIAWVDGEAGAVTLEAVKRACGRGAHAQHAVAVEGGVHVAAPLGRSAFLSVGVGRVTAPVGCLALGATVAAAAVAAVAATL